MQEHELNDCCSNDGQQQPRKEKRNVLIMKASERLGKPSLFCDEIRLSVVKSSGFPDPKDSLLSVCLS